MNGMIRMAQDAQFQLLAGNASNSSGAGAATEAGVYNANGFDGWRGVYGSVGAFSANNAIQVDIGSLNITESIQAAAAKIANNGGNPKSVFLSIQAKQALDIENQNNRRYNDDYVEIITGVRVQSLLWANGSLALIPIPGNTLGQYNRTSDNALVEDIYVVDDDNNTVRWLYSEGFTVLQLPVGYDNSLGEKFIIFGMYGLETAAPLFNGKVRRLYQ